MTTILTIAILVCVLTAMLTTRAHRAGRFLAGMLLLPKLLAVTVVWVISLPFRAVLGMFGAFGRM